MTSGSDMRALPLMLLSFFARMVSGFVWRCLAYLRAYTNPKWPVWSYVEIVLWGRSYLLEKPRSWTKIRCRLNGHPDGPIWYDSGGTEPDYRCINCLDYLG